MRIVLASALLLPMVMAQADQVRGKTDPTGRWKLGESWKIGEPEHDGQRHAMDGVLELKVDGVKLTGHVLTSSGKIVNIQDGEFKNGEFSFITMLDEQSGRKFRWRGKATGDNLSGKVEWEFKRQRGSLSWTATRVKE